MLTISPGVGISLTTPWQPEKLILFEDGAGLESGIEVEPTEQ